MIKETGLDEFTANNVTQTLAMEGVQGGIYHFHETVNPPLQHLPKFLRETSFKNITDASKTAFQPTFNTELPGFMWFPSQPERFREFQKVMQVQRSGLATWLDVYPVQAQLSSSSSEITFIDIGGGFGQQCLALIDKAKGIEGRVVLQDLPQTLDHLPPMPGVEAVAYNFFEPQPLGNADMYYLRNVLHDWPDEASITILKNQISACGPQSRILIDEMVIPNTNANWRSTRQDLAMMSSLGSRERTQVQWEQLLEEAGLAITQIHKYNPIAGDSVIECVPK